MMNHKQFQAWLSQVDRLGTAQRRETEVMLSGGSQASASLAAIEAGVGEDRRCPHSGTPGAVSRGKARVLHRHQCKDCGKTFNAATGTPLDNLHRKERWLPFGTCLADGEAVRASAGRCRPAVNTAFRWRRRFLATESNAEDYLRLYRQMTRIRTFEDCANQLFLDARMPGLTHMYSGQEAVAVGICEALGPADKITSTHRPSGTDGAARR